MKGVEETEERQRAVHAMLRRLEGHSISGDLDADEMAALLAGTLFDSELRMLENRLFVDESLEAQARLLHDDFESGAVPRLVRRQRRTTERAPSKTAGVRFLRRQGPYWLALIVFAIVGILPYSVRSCDDRVEHVVAPGGFVLSAIGSPREILDKGRERVITAGSELKPQTRVRLARNDSLRLLTAGGARRRVDVDGEAVVGTANRVLDGLYGQALRNREARAASEKTMTADSNRSAPRVYFPRGRILETRPGFEWRLGRNRDEVRLRLMDADGRELFARALATTRWAYPAAEPPLTPGRRYRLVLDDRRSFEVLAEADFEVASDDDARAYGELRAELDALGEADPSILEVEWLVGQGLQGQAWLLLRDWLRRDGETIALCERLRDLATRLGLPGKAAAYDERIRELQAEPEGS